MTFRQLIKSSLDELKDLFPEIPSKSLESLASCLSNCKDKQLLNVDTAENNRLPCPAKDGIRNDKSADCLSESRDVDENHRFGSKRITSAHQAPGPREQQINSSDISYIQQRHSGLSKSDRISDIENITVLSDEVKTARLDLHGEHRKQMDNPFKSCGTFNRLKDQDDRSNGIAALRTPSRLQDRNIERTSSLASKLNLKRQMFSEMPAASGDNQSVTTLQNTTGHVAEDGDHSRGGQGGFRSGDWSMLNMQQNIRQPLQNLMCDTANPRKAECSLNHEREDRPMQQINSYDVENDYAYSKKYNIADDINPAFSEKPQTIQTFEYNHGLQPSSSHITEHDNTLHLRNQHDKYSTGNQIPGIHMRDYSNEISAVEGCDELVSLDRRDWEPYPTTRHKTPNMLHQDWQYNMKDRDVHKPINYYEHNMEKEGYIDSILRSAQARNLAETRITVDSNENPPEEFHLNLSSNNIDNDNDNTKSFLLQLNDTPAYKAQKLPVDWKSEILTPGEVYLNPNLKRVSLRPRLKGPVADLEDHQLEGSGDFHQQMAEDLRMSTRRCLENTQQFSKLYKNLERRPLQKVSIGLAQPQPRKAQQKAVSSHPENVTTIPDCVIEASTVASEQQLMQQSMWTTGNSPPMDLAVESDRGAQSLLNKHSYTNREIFMSQTPQKRRRLTYQHTPGRKGQTQLVFR